MPKSVFSDAYAALLEVLVAARKDAKVSQVDLAARLGRGQPFVSLVESGERRIDVVEFCVIARALGYDPAALFAKVLTAVPEGLRI